MKILIIFSLLFSLSSLVKADETVSKLVDEAHIHFNDGVTFGPELGKGFMRMNVACPRSIVQEALDRMKQVFVG